MNEIKSMRIHCLSTALTPITHMMRTSGNEAIINRESVFSAGQLYDVPVLSGNAIRHVMLRESGAYFIVKTCGLYGKLTIDQSNFLFYGGSLTESAISDNLAKITALQELLPLYRLLGGDLKNQILGGSLDVSRGILVCEENTENLEKMLPEELISELPELRPCEDFVSGWQYTRGDATKSPELLNPTEEATGKSNLMIYSGQHIIPGAVFYQCFTFKNISNLELGAFAAALDDWQAFSGIIGGSSRIGHGRLNIELYIDGVDFWGDAPDLETSSEMYREYTRNNADRIAGWLNEEFSAKRAPVKRSAKKSAQPLSDTDFFDEVPE